MVRSGSSKPTEPLLRALDRSGIGGFPAEIWLAIATAMAPDGVRYRSEDVEELCERHPESVARHRTAEGFRYQHARPFETRDTAPSDEDEDEDEIAIALTELLDRPGNDPGVLEYLHRHLPGQCADGAGRGIEALRVRAGKSEIDALLAEALDRRAAKEPPNRRTRLRREAIALFAAVGQNARAAEERAVLAEDLAEAGDFAGAVEQMRRASGEYARQADRDPFYLRFVAIAQLNLGRFYRAAGRRREARAATRLALGLFQSIAADDHRFGDEVRLARRQLHRLHWWRRG